MASGRSGRKKYFFLGKKKFPFHGHLGTRDLHRARPKYSRVAGDGPGSIFRARLLGLPPAWAALGSTRAALGLRRAVEGLTTAVLGLKRAALGLKTGVSHRSKTKCHFRPHLSPEENTRMAQSGYFGSPSTPESASASERAVFLLVI